MSYTLLKRFHHCRFNERCTKLNPSISLPTKSSICLHEANQWDLANNAAALKSLEEQNYFCSLQTYIHNNGFYQYCINLSLKRIHFPKW